MNVTFRQLRAFIEVAECGSFTRAATKMHLTQSALSGLIKELEQTFGAKLFDRTTRQMHLSAVGKRLLPRARTVLHELMELQHEVDRMNNLEQGKLCLAVSQQLAATTMPEMMARFHDLHPNIAITIIDCTMDQVLANVESGKADLGIGAERNFSEDLVAEFLLQMPFSVVLHNAHPLLKKPEVYWQDLCQERLISIQGPFSQRLSSQLPPPLADRIANPDITVNFLSTALGMTRQGLGITLGLPFASSWVQEQGLTLRALHNPVVQRRFYTYRRKSRALSPVVAAFQQFLQDNLCSTPPEQYLEANVITADFADS